MKHRGKKYDRLMRIAERDRDNEVRAANEKYEKRKAAIETVCKMDVPSTAASASGPRVSHGKLREAISNALDVAPETFTVQYVIKKIQEFGVVATRSSVSSRLMKIIKERQDITVVTGGRGKTPALYRKANPIGRVQGQVQNHASTEAA